MTTTVPTLAELRQQLAELIDQSRDVERLIETGQGGDRDRLKETRRELQRAAMDLIAANNAHAAGYSELARAKLMSANNRIADAGRILSAVDAETVTA